MSNNTKDIPLLLIVVFTLFFSSIAFSKDYRIKWKERDGDILYNSVCYNQSGRYDKTPCKYQAKKYFDKKCKQTGSSKFCKASKGFNPRSHGSMSGYSS